MRMALEPIELFIGGIIVKLLLLFVVCVVCKLLIRITFDRPALPPISGRKSS